MLFGNILNSEMKKLAFFDFCDTFVSFQTADAFVDYVRRKNGTLYMKYLNIFLLTLKKIRIIAFFNKFFPKAIFEKKIKLLQLRGFTFKKLNSLASMYYKDMIKPKLIKQVIAEMQRLKKQDYEICLVSAAYSIYLKYFAEEYKIKHIISTEIDFNNTNKRCRGIISGKDCIHIEKVKRIDAYFAEHKVNYNVCISYTDSITDLPLLLLTGKGVVVSHNYPQLWINKYKFKEIIWN